MQENKAPSLELLQSFQLINGLGAESLTWISEQLVPITLSPGTALTEGGRHRRSALVLSLSTPTTFTTPAQQAGYAAKARAGARTVRLRFAVTEHQTSLTLGAETGR